MNQSEKKSPKRNPVSERPMLVCMVKSQAIAYALTCIVFIVYAMLLTYANVSENQIPLVAMVCTAVCCAVAGFDCAKSAKSRGLFWGMGAGAVYVILLFLISIVSMDQFVISPAKFTSVLVGICGGGVGGILGINGAKR